MWACFEYWQHVLAFSPKYPNLDQIYHQIHQNQNFFSKYKRKDYNVIRKSLTTTDFDNISDPLPSVCACWCWEIKCLDKRGDFIFRFEIVLKPTLTTFQVPYTQDYHKRSMLAGFQSYLALRVLDQQSSHGHRFRVKYSMVWCLDRPLFGYADKTILKISQLCRIWLFPS